MFLSANASKRSLACSLREPRGREALLRLVDGADVFLQSLRPGLAERLGLGPDELRAAEPASRLLLDRRVRQRRPAAGRARLRRADAGGGRPDLDDRGARTARRARRLLPHRSGHGHLGCSRDPRRAARARDDRRGPPRRRLAVRDRSRLHRLPPRRLPRGRDGAARSRNRLPDDRALRGDPHARRRADGGGRERSPVRAPLWRARRGRPRDRPALPHEPRPGREPRGADRTPRAVLCAGRHRLLARAAHRRGRSGRTGRGRRRHPRLPADGGARDHAGPPPPSDPGPQAPGAAAVARRRARPAPEPAAAPRRAHRRDPARGRLHRRGDLRAGRSRHRPRPRAEP